MKKIILIFGAVIGILLSVNAIIHMNMMISNPDYKGNDIIGYATLVIMFSLIYFGVRNYRNNYLDGKIGFSKAFKTGALICFVASTFYVVVGLLYYYFFVPDFIDVYADYLIKNSAPDEVEATTAQMANFKEMYKNPLFAILITYMEVFPIGMIVALFSAFIVKKK
ncbi:DUF4199 domain-containing protein [Croceitalea marina]|uniref:DUF4199 domain-containing protein n=1 Tax=Croceitalea marina TaxID=1775166 RepID=A0ABW5MXP9_9FLAO